MTASDVYIGLSGEDTAAMLAAGLARVVEAEQELNRLNVFPIPDRDTGTNMSRTVGAVLDALAAEGPHPSPGAVWNCAARAALFAARGNSGVILTEVFRGFAAGVADASRLDGPACQSGLRTARDYAYEAVAQPVEGTVLTALGAAADRVDSLVAAGVRHPLAIWTGAAEGAREATERGPEMLLVLRQNGVVDAAALGLSLWFSGMAAWVEDATAGVAAPAGTDGHTGPEAPFGFEVQFVLTAERTRREILEALDALGESLVVSGGDGLFRIHIHTPDPGPVLSQAGALGILARVTVDPLTEAGAD